MSIICNVSSVSPMTEPTTNGEAEPPPKYEKPKNWRNAKIKDKSLWFKCDCGPLKLKLNPVVSICSIIIIFAFILWCILEPKRKYLYSLFCSHTRLYSVSNTPASQGIQ